MGYSIYIQNELITNYIEGQKSKDKSVTAYVYKTNRLLITLMDKT